MLFSIMLSQVKEISFLVLLLHEDELLVIVSTLQSIISYWNTLESLAREKHWRPKFKNLVSPSLLAAVIEYYRLGGSKTMEMYFLQF